MPFCEILDPGVAFSIYGEPPQTIFLSISIPTVTVSTTRVNRPYIGELAKEVYICDTFSHIFARNGQEMEAYC